MSTIISIASRRRRCGAAALEIGLDLLGEIAAVGQAGQRIVMRHEVDALFGPDALGDVFEQQHDACPAAS